MPDLGPGNFNATNSFFMTEMQPSLLSSPAPTGHTPRIHTRNIQPNSSMQQRSPMLPDMNPRSVLNPPQTATSK